ncbi:hypothetical protein DDE82_004667 [Stemphylium lycopersici]|uniref:Uncharacterized protein n=1 Tax=Stemphylium lycopersici TaxID=183478 RepID=A0A364N876_STELY|nr:hypothetical protein TW65_02203 [Stemphylium lycopersici]RAR04228.1 hypothetical protein DDE82_004667 [Stemphylium lycopersici]RAR13480.1 hypothetical protein DDE83_003211 [Stemphylium lycopersici]
MFAKAPIVAAIVLLFGAAVQAQDTKAQVCGDKSLNGGCEDVVGDNSCVNIKDDWASSFRTNGLSCTFYDDDNCFNIVIGPTTADNGNLRDTAFNDQINSVRCKKA